MSNKEQPKTIMHEYFELTTKYQTKYGEHTIVFLQVGAFFEVYGIKHNETQEITGSKIQEFTQLTNLNIADKKSTTDGNQTQSIMAGFRDYQLDKYIKKMIDGGYTVVVYTQEKEKEGSNSFIRKFHSVHSSGTYISFDTDGSTQSSNSIMCIWMETYKPFGTTATTTNENLVCGVAIINIFTGKSYLFEYQIPYMLNPTTFDELERCVSTYHPSEVLFLSNFTPQDVQSILTYSGIRSNVIRKINIDACEKAQNCMKQKYILHLLSTFYQPDTYNVCSEFRENHIATQSYCYLLNFIQEHNPDLIRKIELPTFSNTTNRVVLANHTLKQLNMIDDSSNDGKSCGRLSSVVSFLNKCSCAMGRRLLTYQLLHPTFDETWLEAEYTAIDTMRKNMGLLQVNGLRKQIQQIRDMEKILRQLVSRKMYPSSLYYLTKGVEILQYINSNYQEYGEYLMPDQEDPCYWIHTQTTQFVEFVNRNVYMDICHTTNSTQSFDQNIIRPTVSTELDTMIQTKEDYTKSFESIKVYFNQLMRTAENTTNADMEYVKIHETDKQGFSLVMTKKRGLLLQKTLDGMKTPEGLIHINDSIIIPKKDIKLTHATTSNVEIEFPFLQKICRGLHKIQDDLNGMISRVFFQLLETIEKEWFPVLDQFVKYISKLDVLVCKTYISLEYNYCRPEIATTQEKSFVDATELRHVLIERIQTNELYVPNDIFLGKENQDGVLLYGTNAVGKTSLIRSLGISVIMAQSGMYVPCTKFVYKPYTAIYSRILGNDNLFKGLSTFQVEMSELRVILKMADSMSLILGDELCSGTETESALAIFMAGLMDLYHKRSSFIFATHLHEIIHYDEMKELKNNIQLKHLSVIYDREKDCLIYDRKIKSGAGNKMYGLEVCKSLYLPEDFLVVAYQIRNKYHPVAKSGLTDTPSHFNQSKLRGMCELCHKEIGTEIHHLAEQNQANERGFIGTFHKNHTANLVSICYTCHQGEHSQPIQKEEPKPELEIVKIKKSKKVKTTAGYMIV
jgi:DNA mismatch repair protein MutS